MKNSKPIARYALVLALAAALLAAPAISSGQTLRLPPHEKVILKNGLTLLLLEKHGVPIISLAGIVKSGAAADPPGKEGLASVTAGLLRKGTKTRTAQQFAEDLDFFGGSFDADAGDDFTRISAEFLAKDLDRGLELVSDALLHPVFPKEEADKLLRQSLDGIKAAKDEAQDVIGDYYDGYLFLGNAYGRPSGGDELSLARIGREDIARFYAEHYAPGNTILAVAGDFQAPEMRKKLEEVFGGWTGKDVPAKQISPAVPVKGKRLLLVDKPDSTQTFFAIGNVGTARNDPDRVALRLINTIFGGRFTSMLNEELRVESGLTYGAVARFESRKDPGPFYLFSYTQNATTGQAIDKALAVLAKLHKDGVSKEQLDSARSYIKGQFPPSLETSMQLAGVIASNEFYGLTDSEINELEAHMDAVTPEMARQVIARHYPQDNLVFVLIGKAAEIRAVAEKYAPKMDTREIADPGFWPPPAK